MKVVYLVQAGGDGGPVKIGYAVDMRRRLHHMQVHNHEHLKLIVAIPGGLRREKLLHAMFAKERIRGEWYAAKGCLATALPLICRRYPPSEFPSPFLPGVAANTDPDSAPWAGLVLAVRKRLAAAVAHLHATGQLRRADIQRFGEVSTPQASADINLIKARMPGLMEYDPSRKCYCLRSLR